MEKLCVLPMCRRGGQTCDKAIEVPILGSTEKVLECTVYLSPAAWHRKGGCPLNTIPSEEKAKEKKKINPLKASKRARR